RRKISAGLELSSERTSNELYSMVRMMAGLRGKLTASFSAYDIKENRKSFPSSIALQLFRVSGDPAADYDALFNALGDPVGFGAAGRDGGALDETDWWLGALAESDALVDGTEPVKASYEGVVEGLKAEAARGSAKFTEYDGKVLSCGQELDPRENTQVVMSASRIETAAKCPFAYFLEYVLRVKKPEETDRDDFAWLDARERGLLLHKVFEEFFETLKAEKGATAPEREKKVILEILERTIDRFKADIPPPGDSVFQAECAQLRLDAGIFLILNRELGTKQVFSEAVFGGDENKTEIPAGGGKTFLARGKIDRIDKAGPGEYHVWDYKTGSTYVYEEKGFVSGGEQIQHGLYAAAVELILKKTGDKKAKVTCSGYLFPTEKGTRDGKGGIFPRSTDRSKDFQETLKEILDLIGGGNFMVSPEKDACRFCDFADVCGGDGAQARMKAKLTDPANTGIARWDGLKGRK
ncbi:MAG: PD-(D/E)XK nuclease family protein, partial [Candidatus Omnitrophota bacterium]